MQISGTNVISALIRECVISCALSKRLQPSQMTDQSLQIMIGRHARKARQESVLNSLFAQQLRTTGHYSSFARLKVRC